MYKLYHRKKLLFIKIVKKRKSKTKKINVCRLDLIQIVKKSKFKCKKINICSFAINFTEQ